MTTGGGDDDAPSRTVRAGQSIGIGLLILSLIMGSLMFVMFQEPAKKVNETAYDNIDNQTALDGIDNSMTIYAALPTIFLAIAGVGHIVWSIYSAEV